MSLIQDADAFRQAVLTFFQSDQALSGLAGAPETEDANRSLAEDHLKQVNDAIAAPLSLNTSYTPAERPALRYWDGLLASADHPFDAVMETAQRIAPAIHWQMNKNYIGILDGHFFDQECFTEIIGPNGLLYAETCRVGFLILGQDVYYPAHHHEATELYHTVSGSGYWQQGEEEEHPRPSGQPIFHAPWESHAMRTTTPILALWSWAGAIESEAVLI